ncbi:hypothetical protein [uncultured Litoreibacter sp.]|uniref:hypothetical protein n=1 Tax=uncultured Litoreibacter sp. TaxID=1392394 RepID=UPI002634C0C4|nr:hypothetical protein [uncultured Litoreibacter sp.]
MTKIGVHNAYTPCTRVVPTVCAAMMLAGLLTTGAHASAWDEFETRCLVPMENITPFVTEGLSEGTPTSLGDVAWMPDMEGMQYAIPDQPLVMVVASNSVTCMMIQTEASGGDAFAPAEAWAEKSRASGRYEDLAAIRMGVRNINMGSTEWREPRIDMFGDAREDGTLPIFYVMETDLES